MAPCTLSGLVAASVVMGCGLAVNAQDIVHAKVVFKEGDAVSGSTISTLNTPFTDGTGRMAAMVSLADNRRVMLDEDLTVIFNSGSIATPVLSGSEGTIGFSNINAFIYSPSIDGEDGVFGLGGTILRGTDAAPGFPGLFTTFCSRPTMRPNGTAYWVSGTSATSGGATSARVIYQCTDTTMPSLATSILMRGGDTFGGLATTAQGLSFDYAISDNGLHRIHGLTAAGAPAASDVYMAADDVLVAREGSPAPVGNWSGTIRVPSINNSGTYVFGGDTTFATTTADEIIVSNTGMVMQEGTVIGGVTLSGTINALSINNNNIVAFTWGTGANEGLFMGNVATLSITGVKVIKTNDLVDADGDGDGDFTVIDLEASAIIGPGLDLGDDGRVFVEVTIRPIGGTSADDVEAIIRVPGDPPQCVADVDDGSGTGTPDGGVGIEDLLYYLSIFDAGVIAADVDDGTGTGTPDGGVGIEDLLYFLFRFDMGC